MNVVGTGFSQDCSSSYNGCFLRPSLFYRQFSSIELSSQIFTKQVYSQLSLLYHTKPSLLKYLIDSKLSQIPCSYSRMGGYLESSCSNLEERKIKSSDLESHVSEARQTPILKIKFWSI